MGHELHFSFTIDNLIPHADESTSQHIIALWQEAANTLGACALNCVHPGTGKYVDVCFKADFSAILTCLHDANAQSGSFDRRRSLHLQNDAMTIGAALPLTVSCDDTTLDHGAAFALGSVFQQQLFLALNLALPGACQMLGVSFRGEAAHLFEAQAFDSKLFSDARMSAQQQNWPTLATLPFAQVWQWLEHCGFSRADIAISDLNKVLLNLLKLAQQRQRYGSRSALLMARQLELLLGQEAPARLRERCALILGQIPEAADCFIELFRLRADLFQGSHPVRRPALITHSLGTEEREQIAGHNSAIELAASITVALLQQLISQNRDKFSFREVLS